MKKQKKEFKLEWGSAGISMRLAFHSLDGDDIKVFVRVRPSSAELDITFSQVAHVDQSNKEIILKSNVSKPEAKKFTFDYIADIKSTQEQIFSIAAKSIIESCVAGYNGTIFAYGQTGSGKTYTMLGPAEGEDSFQHEMRGIIPRSFECLFNAVNREQNGNPGKEFLLKCTFLEIYNEQVFDLLEPGVGLHMRESMKAGAFVEGLQEVVIRDASEAYQTLNQGWINRTVASTSMNRESSRSHAVFSIVIESKAEKEGVKLVKTSQLNLVDLAGSERQKDTNASGQRLKEASNINQSLSTLGNVINSLVSCANGKTKHVPYRDSKLTFLLRNSLGGNAKTHMIACVHPGAKCFGETLSTLQFAKRAKMIKNKAVINEDAEGNTAVLQAEIRRLKLKLLEYESINKGLSDPASSSSAEPIQTAMQSGANSQYRKMFLQSMWLRHMAEQEIANLKDNIQKLEDICSKKETMLQSTKLIIKFRQNDIERCKKSLAGQQIDKDQETEDLKAEIATLQDQVEKHPKLKEYARDIQNLRAELKKLKAQESVQNMLAANTDLVQMLEQRYRELTSDSQDQKDIHPLTPQSSDNISAATLEKYKSQVQNLQAELGELKQTQAHQKEAAKQKEMELISDLESKSKSIQELEQMLATHQLKSKMEKAAINDMHRKTVVEITTPVKKAKYQLRTRTVLVSGSSENSPSNIPSDTDIEEEGILDEEEPQQMAMQAQQALLEEIKQLQSRNIEIQQRTEEFDTERIQLNQQISKLEHMNSFKDEMIGQYKTKEEEMSKNIVCLHKEIENLKEDKRVAVEEAMDLRLMIKSADRERDSLKARHATLSEADARREQEVESLKTKLMQTELLIMTLTKEKNILEEQYQKLQRENEDLSMTVNFSESRIDELVEQVTTMNDGVEQLKHELQVVQQKFEKEKEYTSSLEKQRYLEGEEAEQYKTRLIEEQQTLKNELEYWVNHSEMQEQNIKLKEKKIEELDVQILTLKKEVEDRKTVFLELMNKLQTDREELKNLQGKLEDSQSRVENLQQKLAEVEKQQEETIQIFEARLHEFEDQKIRWNSELETTNEALESLTVANEHFKQEIEKLQEQYEQEVLEKKSLLEKTSTLEGKLSTYQADLKNLGDLENLAHQVDELTIMKMEKDKEINEIKILLTEKTQEIIQLQERLEDWADLQIERVCLEKQLESKEDLIKEQETIIEELTLQKLAACEVCLAPYLHVIHYSSLCWLFHL
ncbi:hypothetical protein CHS0354_022725 [Potamilus streckersoni]|uniref:Kinesin motor domain-containing protein n=1 Tax=Potamilus streckersoni TaxID=2493646 RepID=A0AAE0RT98_9BIVA|nr:hypothetical protein CHS0354_022725 [Potamilus streckersoni]